MKGKPEVVPHLPSTSIVHLVKMDVCVFYCNDDGVVFQLCFYPILPLSHFHLIIVPLAILK